MVGSSRGEVDPVRTGSSQVELNLDADPRGSRMPKRAVLKSGQYLIRSDHGFNGGSSTVTATDAVREMDTQNNSFAIPNEIDYGCR